MKPLGILIIVLGFILTDSFSILGQDAKTIWFAPLPPLPEYEGRPFIGSLDFMELFKTDAPWEKAAKRVQVFKLYGEWVAYVATDEELKQIVSDLNRRNIAIAFEGESLVPTDACGRGIEGFVGPAEGLLIANRIKAAGGTIHFVALDEPFYYGSLYSGPNACHWPAEKIAQQVASYIQAIKTVFPDVVIGDIEPLPREVNVEEYKNWLDAYQTVTGSNLPFLHLDLDYYRPDWPEAAKELEIYAHERGVKFGIIYIGDDYDNDAEWLAHAEERMTRYETEAGGQPDHVIFQSWTDKPDYCLPETNPNSFTYLINLYFRTRTRLATSPIDPALKQNSPNPFNSSTIIEYEIRHFENVKIQIYNTMGQLVRTLVNEVEPTGIHRVLWDGKNDQAQNLTTGVYFYQLRVGDFMKANRMILLNDLTVK